MHLTYTELPLSHAHSEAKVDKEILTKTLKSRKKTVVTDLNLPPIKTTEIVGIMVHETIVQHSKSTSGITAKDLLVKISSYQGEQVHLVLEIEYTDCNMHYSGTPHKFITY